MKEDEIRNNLDTIKESVFILRAMAINNEYSDAGEDATIVLMRLADRLQDAEKNLCELI